MSAFETVIYEKDGPVAKVILNRPQALNAYNIQMRDDLYEILSAIRIDDEVRVILMQGAGEKAFCAGADLSEFLTAPPPVSARKIRFERDIWGLFAGMPQPLIAALQGYVLGSGVEMAMCCDMRIASEDARFGMPEVALGIIPAAGGTQTLPRVIGVGKSLEMLLTGEWIDAKQALDSKMVNRIVPRDKLYEVCEGLAEKMAAHPPELMRSIKQAVLRGLDLPLEQGLRMEKMLAARIFRVAHPEKIMELMNQP